MLSHVCFVGVTADCLDDASQGQKTDIGVGETGSGGEVQRLRQHVADHGIGCPGGLNSCFLTDFHQTIGS